MAQLLVEIGTEELPAGYIGPALKAFAESLVQHLEQHRISYGAARVFGTPRRLAVMIDDVADRQTPQTQEIMGPPAKVAFDESGTPTVAAKKFAEKNGIPVNRLSIAETEKGRYVVARKTDPGRATRMILKNSLAGLILAIPFPKTMRWSNLNIAFARPIHSVLALLGGQVISFMVGDIKSNRYTFGHRFLHPKKIKLSDSAAYLPALQDAWVMADISRRRAQMGQQMAAAVKPAGGYVLPDEELVDIVTNLIEYPATILGAFDERFLEIPREVLITAMREHQRYFAVVDGKNQVMPYFLAVNNTLAKDMDLVKRGHERVLKARLEDARFFFKTDLNISPDDMTDKLKHVLFQADLGSVFDKVSRVRSVAEKLAGHLALAPETAKQLDRAAWLSKADLVSHMVNEFPKLQGVMGRIYALGAGEEMLCAQAIEEHYRPVYSGGQLPETLPGSVLSISEKIDTICGCFLIGLIPTGTSDPYALRRQGIGLLQIILENGFTLAIDDLVRMSLSTFTDIAPRISPEKAAEQVASFLMNRLAHILESEGVAKDAVAAVLAVSQSEGLPVIAEKARSLQRLKTEPEFETLATGFKRVVNIIRKADSADTAKEAIEPGLFEYPAENALFEKFTAIQDQVRQLLAERQIDEAFTAVSTLRAPVDKFFDDVLVMTDDAALRQNRLALLSQISRLFALLADFSRIST